MLLPAFALGSLIWDEVSERRGHATGIAHAQNELGLGKVGIKGCGKPQHWIGSYKSLLMNQFGVEYDHVAGCVPTRFEFGYIRGYNQTMRSEWNRRSVDFDALRSEARRRATFSGESN
jgi:hypothetical protein